MVEFRQNFTRKPLFSCCDIIACAVPSKLSGRRSPVFLAVRTTIYIYICILYVLYNISCRYIVVIGRVESREIIVFRYERCAQKGYDVVPTDK